MSFFFGKKKTATPAAPVEAEQGFLTGDADSDARNVKILLDTIAQVNVGVDLEELLESVVDKTVGFTRTERGILLLADENGELQVRVARDAAKRSLPPTIQFSRTIPAKAYSTKKELRAVVTTDEEARQLGVSVLELKLRSVMCAPLTVEGGCIGAIYVDSKAKSREFSASDLSLFCALAQQLAVAIQRANLIRNEMERQRMQRDLEQARSIQSYFYPEKIPRPQGFDIAAANRSADETTGDYYDFLSREDGPTFGIAVGDVSGHGVGAALILSKAQALLQTYFDLLGDLDLVLATLNKKLSQNIEDGKFLTLFLGELDPVKKTISYNNAGHCPPLLLRGATRSIETLDRTGIAIGLLPDSTYSKRASIALEPGDTILLYTDGITEAMDTESRPFGEESLRKVLLETSGAAAQEVVDEVMRRVQEHEMEAATSLDDKTVIAIKATH
jgi:serine phosphatase RsbU (regulator of sigma subunit)